MDKQFITREEAELLGQIRRAPAYSDFEVQKRPTAESPDGQIIRVLVKTSVLIHKPENKITPTMV